MFNSSSPQLNGSHSLYCDEMNIHRFKVYCKFAQIVPSLFCALWFIIGTQCLQKVVTLARLQEKTGKRGKRKWYHSRQYSRITSLVLRCIIALSGCICFGLGVGTRNSSGTVEGDVGLLFHTFQLMAAQAVIALSLNSTLRAKVIMKRNNRGANTEGMKPWFLVAYSIFMAFWNLFVWIRFILLPDRVFNDYSVTQSLTYSAQLMFELIVLTTYRIPLLRSAALFFLDYYREKMSGNIYSADKNMENRLENLKLSLKHYLMNMIATLSSCLACLWYALYAQSQLNADSNASALDMHATVYIILFFFSWVEYKRINHKVKAMQAKLRKVAPNSYRVLDDIAKESEATGSFANTDTLSD